MAIKMDNLLYIKSKNVMIGVQKFLLESLLRRLGAVMRELVEKIEKGSESDPGRLKKGKEWYLYLLLQSKGLKGLN